MEHQILIDDKMNIDTPSRLFLYYNARCEEGNGAQYIDEGTTIRDAMKSITKYNFVDEKTYEYNDSHILRPPPMEIYNIAKMNPYHINYYRSVINTEYNLKYILSEIKSCIVFGAILYDSFTHLDWKNCVPNPDIENDKLLGRHCMVIVGYDDVISSFKILNSWGLSFGDNGFCYMSYKYVCSDLCTDFWIISGLEKD